MGTITIKDGISLAGTDGKLVTTAALNDAEGDEVALQLNYTTNKATSGADTGLEIVQTDTASPGTSYLINAKVATTSKFNVDNTGKTTITQSSAGTALELVGPTTGNHYWWFAKSNTDAISYLARSSSALVFALNSQESSDTGLFTIYPGNHATNQRGIFLPSLNRIWWASGGDSYAGAGDTALGRSAAGVVKVTAGSTGVGRIRFEKDKREFGTHKTPGTAATVTEYGGAPTHTLSGTASNVSDATGHYVQLSGDGAAAGIDLAATECVKTEIDPVVTFIIKTGAALPTDATERIWVGLASASLAASDSPSGIHVAAFRYAIDTDNTAFWRCVTNDGGADAGTATVTTAAIAVGTRYRLTIDAEDSASIKFFVDGALVATHTTNLPTTTQALGCTCLTVDAGANTQEILISKIHYETT